MSSSVGRRRHRLACRLACLTPGRRRSVAKFVNVFVRIAILAVLLAPICETVVAAAAPSAETQHHYGLQQESALGEYRWIHGSSDCTANADPALDIYAADRATYILRQNKCTTYEAPFIYVLIGESKVLILDTGAIEDDADTQLYEAVETILAAVPMEGREILVIHSHGHRDHYNGDAQFRDKPSVTLVEARRDDVVSFFGFTEWPSDQATIDLGGRALTVIPTPGHQEEAITLYDQKTRWLLTGDTLYPGYIYVKNWEDYKDSIARLARFAESNEVVGIMGAHIEMTTDAGQYYPIGTTFQPDEAALPLPPDSLQKLNDELQSSDEKDELVFDQFIVAPMNILQIALSNMARWITQ